MTRAIEIVEVGPRDGLQNEKTHLSVEEKLDFIRRLEGAGARRVEAVSFVNPKRVPQMAGAEEVMAGLGRDGGRSRIGLVLNKRGWDRAVESRCDEANYVVCASDTFGIRNQGASRAEQIAALGDIARAWAAQAGGPRLSVTIATAFGCPFEGEVPETSVAEVIAACAEARVPEIALADTIGVGDPWAVRRLVRLTRRMAREADIRLHFHDTRGAGLANAAAAVDEGATILDSSCGGIGGCPFAPAATGNIATEDLVYMLERGGFSTGLNLDALIETADWIGAKLGRPHPSALSRAGGFPKAA